MATRLQYTLACASLTALLSACGGDDPVDPTEIGLGETTFLLVVNPTINDANDAAMTPPGAQRADVRVRSDDGLRADTDVLGLAVLREVEPGERLIDLEGDGSLAERALEIESGDLREVAISFDGDRAEVMSEAVFAFGARVVEVTPDTPLAEVEAALSESDTIVLFQDGIYAGDLDFSGSNVTLFGAGPRGGRVVLDGDITVAGSGNRLRGATITGNLDISGSDASVSFSRFEGRVEISGSDVILLFNDACGEVEISGSGTTALDNTGMAPLDRLDDCDGA